MATQQELTYKLAVIFIGSYLLTLLRKSYDSLIAQCLISTYNFCLRYTVISVVYYQNGLGIREVVYNMLGC